MMLPSATSCNDYAAVDKQLRAEHHAHQARQSNEYPLHHAVIGLNRFAFPGVHFSHFVASRLVGKHGEGNIAQQTCDQHKSCKA